MAKRTTLTISPLRQQVGSYGIAQPDVPITMDEGEARKLLKTKLWVEGKTDRAKAREKKAAEERAAAEAAAKRQATAKATA